MALITINDLLNTLEDTRTTLLSAANGDGMVSRADLKQLLQQTEDPLRRRFLEFFYGFLFKLENKPRMRVTREVIDTGISFIQDQIIPHVEIKSSFTSHTIQKIAQISDFAYPLAMELIRYTAENVILSPQEVSEQIAPLTEGLVFDDYGSEAAIPIETFFLEHPVSLLTPDSFTKALGLAPDTMESEISRFDPAERVLLSFIDYHVALGLGDRARSVVELMQENLRDFTVIIRGEDFNPVFESNHPVYVVGMGLDGDLAGFSSFVVWT